MKRTFAIILFVLLLAGCYKPLKEPYFGQPVSVSDGYTITVIESTPLGSYQYIDDTQKNLPAAGKAWWAVTLEFAIPKGSYTILLNLDDVLVTTPDGTKYPAATLTLGPPPGGRIDAQGFYPSVGADGRTLDFGLGFKGMDMTMSTTFEQGKTHALTTYHGDTPIYFTFIFELPEGQTATSIIFNGSVPITLIKPGV